MSGEALVLPIRIHANIKGILPRMIADSRGSFLACVFGAANFYEVCSHAHAFR